MFTGQVGDGEATMTFNHPTFHGIGPPSRRSEDAN